MRHLTVATRLSLGFAAVIILLIVVAGVGINRLAQLDEVTRLIAKDRWVKAQLANDILQHVGQIAISLQSMALAERREDMMQEKERVVESRRAIGRTIETLQPLVTLPRGQELLGQIRMQRERYIGGQEKLIALIEGGEAESARRYLNRELRPIMSDYQGAVTAFRDFQAELVTQASQTAGETYESARNLNIAAVLLSLLAAVGLSSWIIRSVTGPLGGEPDEAKAVVERIAEGDLTADIRVKPGDDSSLIAVTARMQAKLRRLMNELQANAEGVAESAQQLAAGSAQVATATEE